MTCPHCQATINRKERTNRTCSKCNREFAFDPKQNSLGLHDLRFRKTVDRLGAGGFKFTAGQLLLALSRKPAIAAGGYGPAIGLGIAGLLIAIFGGAVAGEEGALYGLVLMGLGLLAAFFKQFEVFNAITDANFRGFVLERWRAIYGEMPRGLVGEDSLAGLTEEDRPLQNLFGVVVCPDREVLTCLLANGVPRDLQLGLLPTAPPENAWERRQLELLQQNPRLPILLLHDASAECAFLAQDLPKLLGLDARHRIFDLGLNPKKSIAKGRTILDRTIPAEICARLDREAIGADVAGSRPIRRGRAQVTPEELVWLKGGKCSPVRAVPPASIIKRLKLALGKLSPRQPPARVEAESLQSVGFLTGPV